MKNKYNIYSTYYEYDKNYKDYGNYINMTDYLKEYYNYNWTDVNIETEEERLSREKAEKRDAKIDQILG